MPALVANGTISAENARAIEKHYGADADARGVGFAVLASIGTALVAAGIVLLVAHNWDEFSRSARSVIAFVPLIAAQILGAFVLARRDESKAWREASAIFNVAAVGAAISLISQTYQIHGSFADFVLVWCLLSLPLVYLFRTTLVAVAYLLGAVTWVFVQNWHATRVPLWFWLIWAGVLPYAVTLYRRDRTSWSLTNVAVFAAIAAAIGLGVTADWTNSGLGAIAFAGFFTAIYLSGIELFPLRERDRLHPLAVLGGIAIGVTAVVLTFRGLWDAHRLSPLNAYGVVGVVIELLFPIAAVAFAASRFIRRRDIGFSILVVGFPVVVLIAWAISRLCPSQASASDGSRCAVVAAIVMNLYTLALSVELLMRGMRADSLPRANFGLLLMAALAAARFLDSDVSFVVRGVGFIAIGIGFLLTNMFLFRRRSGK